MQPSWQKKIISGIDIERRLENSLLCKTLTLFPELTPRCLPTIHFVRDAGGVSSAHLPVVLLMMPCLLVLLLLLLVCKANYFLDGMMMWRSSLLSHQSSGTGWWWKDSNHFLFITREREKRCWQFSGWPHYSEKLPEERRKDRDAIIIIEALAVTYFLSAQPGTCKFRGSVVPIIMLLLALNSTIHSLSISAKILYYYRESRTHGTTALLLLELPEPWNYSKSSSSQFCRNTSSVHDDGATKPAFAPPITSHYCRAWPAARTTTNYIPRHHHRCLQFDDDNGGAGLV